MKTVNELYKFYFNHDIKPSQVCRLWADFNGAAEKVTKLKFEKPAFVDLCTKYACVDET